jgi:DNA-binding response OmpR family regulator
MQTATSLPPHVLALDDDPSIRALVSDYLTESELRVTAVASGSELAAVMAREAIDLVVLDVRLQGEDGMQIARAETSLVARRPCVRLCRRRLENIARASECDGSRHRAG